jgi:hypothetical protein
MYSQYLLRVLLDRLGLLTRPDQLRIIASSASLSSEEEGREYLEHFFGRNRQRFSVLAGTIVPPAPASIPSVQAQAAHLQTLAQGLRSPDAAMRTAAAQAFHAAVGAPALEHPRVRRSADVADFFNLVNHVEDN